MSGLDGGRDLLQLGILPMKEAIGADVVISWQRAGENDCGSAL
jgi:hypothetical protein